MKIPTKLEPSDLAAYTAGRPSKVSHKPFKFDLAALQPGSEKGPLNPLDLSAFKTGGAGKASLKPLDLSAAAGPQVTSTKSEHDQITEQAQKWVAQTFFGTLMKQMSESPFKSELFSGGRGGEAFSSLYHQQLVDHMSRGAGSKLVNSLVSRIEAKQKAEKESGFRVQGSEKNSSPRPTSDHDPRTKAYNRTSPAGRRKQSNFDLAA